MTSAVDGTYSRITSGHYRTTVLPGDHDDSHITSRHYRTAVLTTVTSPADITGPLSYLLVVGLLSYLLVLAKVSIHRHTNFVSFQLRPVHQLLEECPLFLPHRGQFGVHLWRVRDAGLNTQNQRVLQSLL